MIDKMVRTLQVDAPWSFGFYPYASAVVQGCEELQARHPDPPLILAAMRLTVLPRAELAGLEPYSRVVALLLIAACRRRWQLIASQQPAGAVSAPTRVAKR
ncbi:MAG: hypothetical protein IPJ08_14095 [Burkholderiales bacterium]|nr:hypothetical protein [Burkholderiales bacterium]